MAPTTSKSSKGSSDAPVPSKSSHFQHSKSHDSQNPLGSPSSKSHNSSRTSGNKGKEGRSHHHHHKRRKSSIKSSLQETLSSFGDDVIKVKNWPVGLAGYDNHGYFQPEASSFNIPVSHDSTGNDPEVNSNSAAPFGDISSAAAHMENGGVENELALIMSQHDPNFQTKHFEKVNPSEVGVRPSKWQKLLQASVSSNRFQKIQKQDKRHQTETDNCLEQFYDGHGQIRIDPPFWGVSRTTRGNVSFLSLSLILHELACFTSCVLLGCVIFQGMESISWVQQKPFNDNWIFFKWYSSFQTILVVITCLGFLNRVDTTEQRSLWMLPLFLIPVLCLSVSDYCNKTWELQRLECHNFYRLDVLSKQKVHLTQDCSSVTAMLEQLSANVTTSKAIKESSPKLVTALEARGVAPLIMRMLATISTLVISSFLFCCRKNHYLIDSFGPPKELVGNIESVLRFQKNKSFQWSRTNEVEGNEEDEVGEDGMNVIYRRNEKSFTSRKF